MIHYIKSPVLSPTTIRLIENNQYTFDVDPKTTKQQVKHWIETFFKVKVIHLNSHQPPSQMKRMRNKSGYKRRYKRMIVTIQSGEYIPVI